MTEHLERIGQRIGDYRLQRWLGGGGFGDVYLAEQIHDHIPVAVKLLQIRLSRSDELKAFINEARTMRLKHPHIVPLLDFGIDEEDLPFLAMEYAPLGTLRDRYPKGTHMPLASVRDYVHQVSSALQYAHEHRLIHRDVKPENMLLRSDETVLLSDFGIVTVVHSSHSLGVQQGVSGTIPYMAPEQLQGKPRPASDQYSLGIVVYEWITGRRPFVGTSVEIAMQHATAPPPSLLELVPLLPKEVEQVVLKALAKEPKDRFETVQDFAHSLELASWDTSSHILVSPSPPSIPSPLPMAAPANTIYVPQHPFPGAEGAEPERQASSPGHPVSMPSKPTMPSFRQASLPETHPSSSEEFSHPSSAQYHETSPSRKSSSSSDQLQAVIPQKSPLVRSEDLSGRGGSLVKLKSDLASSKKGRRSVQVGAVMAFLAILLIGASGIYWKIQADTASPTTAPHGVTSSTVARGTTTPTSIAPSTVTATAPVSQYAYNTVTSKTPVLDDPLHDNSKGYNWGGEGAQFTPNGLLVTIGPTRTGTPGYTFSIAQNTSFQDFAYQVQMKITSGQGGGIFFRVNQTSHGYLFRIVSDGSYDLRDVTNIAQIAKGRSSAIHTGLNQSNLIAVIAHSSTLDLYVNKQHIASVSTHGVNDESGNIGVFAFDDGSATSETDILFSNAKVWPLPAA